MANILIDSNIVHHCINKNKKNINYEILENTLAKNKIFCSIYTLFELMNTKNIYDKRLQHLNFLKKYKIGVIYDEEYFGKFKFILFNKDIKLDEKLLNDNMQYISEKIINQIIFDLLYFENIHILVQLYWIYYPLRKDEKN